MPRQYIANVVYTFIGDDFQAWMDVGIEARNQKVKDDRDMDIKMDPEIFAISRIPRQSAVSTHPCRLLVLALGPHLGCCEGSLYYLIILSL